MRNLGRRPLRRRRHRRPEPLRLNVVPQHGEALEPPREEERVGVHPRGAVSGAYRYWSELHPLTMRVGSFALGDAKHAAVRLRVSVSVGLGAHRENRCGDPAYHCMV
jgi:hypothetical protein